MIDLQQLQILAQLMDNMNMLAKELEKAYASHNAEEFNKVKKEILDTQRKISGLIK